MQAPTSSSQLLDGAVTAFSSLPGIGRKTAMRLALYLLQQAPEHTEEFCSRIANMRSQIKFCTRCHNLADGDLCSVCASARRNHKLVCVVESIREAMAIEQTGQYEGSYHILGGLIAPIEGVGPSDLTLASLIHRVKEEGVEELILALSPSIEGETTAYYLAKQVKDLPVRISTIARGVSFGGELEYADELSLSRSISGRLPYQNRD